jgi:NAD(P)-dependent dehydrogenase (short-subunit alcohol dehydrogenase family)
MTAQKIFILGGTGNTGSWIARYLLAETGAKLVVSSRSLEKAKKLAANLNQDFGTERVSACRAEAADLENLREAFQEMDWVVAGSSTARYTANVARAAIEAGANYLDVQFGRAKFKALRQLEAEIKARGLCFITDGGFHPGVPAAMVRRAAGVFDSLQKAVVGSVIQIDWGELSLAQATGDEMIEEIMDIGMAYYQDGRWRQANWTGTSGLRYFEFGPVFGRRYTMPMTLEEMRALPESFPDLRETGFYVGGFNWFVDWIVFPLAYLALKIFPKRAVRPMSRLLHWGLVKFTRPPYGTILKLEAAGLRDGEPAEMEIWLSHPDGYVLTAVPVVACLLQCLDGSAHKPGLWTQAWIVAPDRFIKDIQRMGIELKEVFPEDQRQPSA